MIKRKSLVAIAAVLAAWTSAAHAEDNLKVGIIATLSGPPAVLGQQLRNGFTLAVKDLGGKLGGRDTEIVVADDELKPDVAVTKVKSLIDRDKVDFVVGPIFSNILGAIAKPVTEANVILISPNAGTSSFAGKDCNPNFFVTSYQNDQVHEVLGQYAQDTGFKKVIIIVPNYQAGKDAAAGFKHKFTGEILDEMYVPLGQLDYSAELSRIAAASPGRDLCLHPRRHGREFRQAVPAVRPRRQDHVPVRVHGRRIDAAGAAGRRARHARRLRLGAQSRHPAKQGVRRGICERVQRHSGDLRLPGLRRRVADRQRGARGQRQSRRQGRAARGAQESRLQVAARRVSSSTTTTIRSRTFI